MYNFERIIVEKGVSDNGILERAKKFCPDARVEFYDELPRVEGDTTPEKIFNGKKTLALTDRKSDFVSPFDKAKGDTNSICPTFWKLVPYSNCNFRCNYCFLLGTYRLAHPYVHLYMNTDKMILELDKQIAKHPGRTRLYNTGEMADSLHLDPISEYSKLLVPYFAGKKDGRLYMLTKSANVENLLDLDHRGHSIVAWSINADIVSKNVEEGAASLEERIEAARKCAEAGYSERLRFDPLLPVPDWKRHYSEFVERVLSQLKPERITLGTFRLLGSLSGFINKCYPGTPLSDLPVIKGDKNTRGRIPTELRMELYDFVIDEIRKRNSEVLIDLCKEDKKVKQALKDKINWGQCVCI